MPNKNCLACPGQTLDLLGPSAEVLHGARAGGCRLATARSSLVGAGAVKPHAKHAYKANIRFPEHLDCSNQSVLS